MLTKKKKEKKNPLNEGGIVASLKVLDEAESINSSSIAKIAMNFLQLVPEEQLNDLDDQWRSFHPSKRDIVHSNTTMPEFWYSLWHITDRLINQSKYRLLSSFILIYLFYPTLQPVQREYFCRLTD